MKTFKAFKTFLIICVLIRAAESIAEFKWHKTDDSMIFFIDAAHKYNWFEAWNECAVRNMTLIAVDTREKHAALNRILRKKFEKSVNLWIGGHDLGEHSKFIWSSTGKRFDFSNWSKANPNNLLGLEHCVHIWDTSDFEWNDVPCTSKMGYICEENLFILATRRDMEIKKHFIDQLFALYETASHVP